MRKRFFAMFLALAAGARLATPAIPDTYQPPAPAAGSEPAPAPKMPSAKPAKNSHASAATAQTLAEMQSELDQLTKSNHDLLDLLKQQQSVLQDMQFDRRLQSRQIQSLEDRLEEAINEKHQLEDKVQKLETQAAEHPASTAAAPGANAASGAAANPPQSSSPVTAPTIESVKPPDADPAPAPPPASYLPPEGADNPPGQQWHRLFTIKGDDNRQTDVFLVHGRAWRVLWHNQDKPGKIYENTSALFINAFPRDDTIPQKVCSKLGSGGDKTVLAGPGNYYLRIEASGGNWEIAVEDLR